MTAAVLRPEPRVFLSSLLDALIASFGPADPPQAPQPATTAERLGVARWDAFDVPTYRRRGLDIPGIAPSA